MALSNIFKEPRREITETAMGVLVTIVVVPLIVYAWWNLGLFMIWLTHDTPSTLNIIGDAFFGMLGGIVLLAALSLVVIAIHAIGETICNKLQRRGIELRPKQRYN